MRYSYKCRCRRGPISSKVNVNKPDLVLTASEKQALDAMMQDPKKNRGGRGGLADEAVDMRE